MGVCEIRGMYMRVPKDCSIWGLYWGPLIQRNYHIDVGMRARGAGEA